MKKVLWRIYYGNGTTFDNAQGKPNDAPIWDVQAIVQPHIESGKYVICLYDYYIYRDGRWFGVDSVGVVDYLLRDKLLGRLNPDATFSIKGRKVASLDFILYGANKGFVKIGRMLRKEEFRKIYQKANEDKDFPIRTAYRANERRV